MKIIIPLALLCLLSSLAQAQISKGSILAGGSLIAGRSTYQDPGSNNNSSGYGFIISPSVGIAVSKNVFLGLGINYGKGKFYNPVFTNGHSYGANIFSRRYYPLGKGFHLFGELSANYYYQIDEPIAPYTTSTREGWSTGLSLAPGIDFAVNRRLHLEAGLSHLFDFDYSKLKETDPSNPYYTHNARSVVASSSLNNNLPIFVGLRLLFSKKS